MPVETKSLPSFSSEFPVDNLLKWYRLNKRQMPWRETDNLYHIWVSEVMLQQTQVKTVLPYYTRFISTFPTLRDLADAPLEKVLKIWEGLGYYSRAKHIHKAAGMIMERFGGKIPSDPAMLRKLPGIGPYIAAALLSIGYRQPVPVVDGNVFRVYTRFFENREDIRSPGTGKAIYSHLGKIIPSNDPGDFNQALMELGALVCTPRSPGCPSCPLGDRCRARAMEIQEELPFKSALKKPPTYRVSLAVLIHGRSFFIQQRPPEGHLGGLWEFPGGKSGDGETPLDTVRRECVEELGHRFSGFQPLTRIKHQYTHFKIDVTVFTCRLNQRFRPVPEIPFRWIRFEDIDLYPFPKANHKIFPSLKDYLHQTTG